MQDRRNLFDPDLVPDDPIAGLLGTLRGELTELPGDAERHVRAAAAATARRRHHGISVAAVVLAFVVVGGGAAWAGALPTPIQRPVARVAAAVGWELPGSVDPPPPVTVAEQAPAPPSTVAGPPLRDEVRAFATAVGSWGRCVAGNALDGADDPFEGCGERPRPGDYGIPDAPEDGLELAGGVLEEVGLDADALRAWARCVRDAVRAAAAGAESGGEAAVDLSDCGEPPVAVPPRIVVPVPPVPGDPPDEAPPLVPPPTVVPPVPDIAPEPVPLPAPPPGGWGDLVEDLVDRLVPPPGYDR